jgi:DNA repair protein RadA/Sms
VAAALISALANVPLPKDSVAFGEVALSGDVRPVGRMDARLKEAAKLGFKKAFAPDGADGAGIAVHRLTRLGDLAAAIDSGVGERRRRP